MSDKIHFSKRSGNQPYRYPSFFTFFGKIFSDSPFSLLFLLTFPARFSVIHLFLRFFWWLFQWWISQFTIFITNFGDFLVTFFSLWYFPFFSPFLVIFSVTFSATLQIHHYFWCFPCHLFRPHIFLPFYSPFFGWFLGWQIILSYTPFDVIVAFFALQCRRVQDFFKFCNLFPFEFNQPTNPKRVSEFKFQEHPLPKTIYFTGEKENWSF